MDDTTVFLSEYDKFVDVEAILNKWCIASGARFNVNKTEVLHVGHPLDRKEVVVTCCIHPSQETLANTIHNFSRPRVSTYVRSMDRK